jgi:hypothetical protein
MFQQLLYPSLYEIEVVGEERLTSEVVKMAVEKQNQACLHRCASAPMIWVSSDRFGSHRFCAPLGLITTVTVTVTGLLNMSAVRLRV